MSDKRYEANIIRATAVEPANNLETTSAPGVWSIDEVVELQKKEKWPTAGNVTTDVDQVFSTFLYDGNGIVQKIENGIQLGAASTDNVALHMTGATSTDNGPLSLTVNSIGNATTSTTQTKFTSKSLYVDGTGSGDATTCFDIQEGQIKLAKKDFTIEYWVYYNSHNSYGDLGSWNYYVSGYNGNFRMGIGGTGTNINIFAYDAQTLLGSVSGTVSVSTGTWYHVAISRSNGTAYLFLDGTLVTSGAFDHDLTDAEIGGITLGKISAYEQVDAYFSDFRITVGAARYTSSFTAPSAALPVDSGTSGEGGLVWIKNRDVANSNQLFDTERGALYRLNSDTTNAASNSASGALTAFNSNGFTVGDWGPVNNSGSGLVSWTWRKAPKWFDVVTWSGDNTNSRAISHNLGCEVGAIFIKNLTSSENWVVYHRGAGLSGSNPKLLKLNLTDASEADSGIIPSAPTTTEFYVSNAQQTNAGGKTYVAYLFAHNDGDGEFGPDGSQDIIKCGSYTGTGSEMFVDLGFEPQFFLTKRTDSATDWFIVDVMRGMAADQADPYLKPNATTTETNTGGNGWHPSPTGITIQSSSQITSGANYIYMAIRRGPLAAPESATDVFDVALGTGTYTHTTGFPVDLALQLTRQTTIIHRPYDRLRGGTKYLETSDDSVEQSGGTAQFDNNTGYTNSGATLNCVDYMWKRAPSYFDVCCYSGTGSARTVGHNLGVAPEMIWVKPRETGLASNDWWVFHKDLSTPADDSLNLNSTSAENTGNGALLWNSTMPTSSVFSLGSYNGINQSGRTYIAYLFATIAGVSKVGSFTGTGSDINIDCGFSSGARFILIKRTNSTSPWWTFDTARGIVAGDDPVLELNSTNAEYTSYDFVDPLSSGFTVTGTFSSWNQSGSSYIFYAIA